MVNSIVIIFRNQSKKANEKNLNGMFNYMRKLVALATHGLCRKFYPAALVNSNRTSKITFLGWKLIHYDNLFGLKTNFTADHRQSNEKSWIHTRNLATFRLIFNHIHTSKQTLIESESLPSQKKIYIYIYIALLIRKRAINKTEKKLRNLKSNL